MVETSIQTTNELNAKRKLEGIRCYQNIFIFLFSCLTLKYFDIRWSKCFGNTYTNYA